MNSNGILAVALALVTTLAGVAVLSARAASRISTEQERHAAWITAQKLTRTRARADRELSALEESQRQSERRRAEQVQAAGGELAYALCDPGVSLRRSLTLIAENCLPAGTTVEVRVERFVEFEVMARLPARVAPGALAQATRCLLIEAAGLVHSLTFVADGTVAARLDRQTIESVADWAAIPDSQLESLLSDGDGAPEPARPSRVGIGETQPEEPESVSPELQRLREIQAAFSATLQERIAMMNAKAEQLLKLSNLGTVTGVPDLNSRISQARTLATEIKDLRPDLVDPFPEMTQQLLNAGVDPVVVRVTIRTARERTQAYRVAAGRILSSLVELEPPLEQFLITAGRTWGRWTTEDEGTTLSFEDAEAREIIVRRKAILSKAIDAYNAAVDQWNRLP